MVQKERISEWQMAVLMASGFVELGLYSYPKQLAEDPSRLYYPELALATAMGLFLALTSAHLALRFPQKSVIQIMFAVLGKPLGMIAAIWIIWFHLFLAALCLRYFGDVVNSFFLPLTPPEVVMLLVVLAVVFINAQGVAAIARFGTAMFPTVMVLITIAFLMSASRITEWNAVFPTVRDLSSINLLTHSSRIFYLFVGVESILMLMSLVGKPQRPYLAVVTPVLANGIFLLIVLIVTLGVLGAQATAELETPALIVLRTLRLQGLLVERLGGMIAILWTALKVGYLSVRFMTVPMAIAQLFGLSVAEYRKFLLPVALITFFLARWPRTLEETIRILENFVGPVGLPANLGMVLLLLGVASLRGMGKIK